LTATHFPRALERPDGPARARRSAGEARRSERLSLLALVAAGALYGRGAHAQAASPSGLVSGERVETVSTEDPLESPAAAQPLMIWGAPFLTIVDLVQLQFSFPVGVTIPLSRRVTVVVDAVPEVLRRGTNFAPPGVTDSDSLVGCEGGVGIGFNILRDSRSTPFVVPKVGYAIRNVHELYTTATGGGARRDELELQLGPGLDVGWQFHAHHFGVSVLFGISATYCWNCVFLAPRSPSDPTQVPVHGNGILPLFNFEIARIAVAF
jgi:hypothetical protein